MIPGLFGALGEQRFMTRCWQKRPLLVRGALRGYAAPPALSVLRRLAARDDLVSRLVTRQRATWRVRHGPLPAHAMLPRSAWSLLVNGIERHHAGAAQLLEIFAFLPRARLDDVMLSAASPGGGVGPHFDSYDVFLVQARGRRVWRLARPRRWSLVKNAPLRLIADFRAEEEWLVEPGDLLYLPPGWGHDGIALDHCLTWSVGFRAPQGAALAAEFFAFLEERGLAETGYRDPGLRPTRRPGAIPPVVLRGLRRQLERQRWRAADVTEFAGHHLSTPRPEVVFAPRRPVAKAAFARRLRAATAHLDPASRLLYLGRRVWLNGEPVPAAGRAFAALAAFADRRAIAGRRLVATGLGEAARGWYNAGWLHLEGSR